MIGLSGLITPSLDEMGHVAGEMEREGFNMPLLIGGATTSRVHTAVKIAPNYVRGQTIYVPDASRAVGVVSNLLSDTERALHARPCAPTTTRCARPTSGQQEAAPAAEGRARERLRHRLSGYTPPRRARRARAPSRSTSSRARAHIDWTPFFQTWELVGKYPRILEDNVVGGEATKLFADAQAMLKRIVAEKWLTASAVVGFWPANAVGDDIELYADEARSRALDAAHPAPADGAARAGATGPTRRSPTSWRRRRRRLADYVGAFAVTAGIGETEALAADIDKTDDYGASC